MAKWRESDIPSMVGRKVLVTGATSGIGFEAVAMLVESGAEVWLSGRTIEKAEAAIDAMKRWVPNADLHPLALELGSLDSVALAAKQLTSETESLDILINNAGVMAIPFARTEDRFEMQFGVNHLGHFALTAQLFPLLEKGTDQRVVTLSSIAHRPGKIDFDSLNAEKGYNRQRAYTQSKLANLLFAKELARCTHSVKSIAVHPGYASTRLQERNAQITSNTRELATMKALNRVIGQSARKGAWPTIYVATNPDVQNGQFIGPRVLGVWGAPRVETPTKAARDETVAKRLWEESERLTKISFAI